MKVYYSKAFKRDLAKFLEVTVSPEFVEIMYLLQRQEQLPPKYKDHALKGEWLGFRDCHIRYDLVLIYEIRDGDLFLARMNTHSEVFK